MACQAHNHNDRIWSKQSHNYPQAWVWASPSHRPASAQRRKTHYEPAGKKETILWHLEVQRKACFKKIITPNWTVDGPKAVISEIHTQALDFRRKLHITPLILFPVPRQITDASWCDMPIWQRPGLLDVTQVSSLFSGLTVNTTPPLNDTQHSTPGWLSYWSRLTADAQLIYTFWSKFSGVRKKL